MSLETTLICIDNSEHTRNGDYLPTRLDVQRDAANLICGAKTNQNAENCVGLLTAAGDRTVVRVTPTQDVGKILQALHNIQSEGELDVTMALQTAQLALKHRMHKNHRQRIILFVGSPVTASEKKLDLVGRRLKKNNVSLDIVSFGDTEVNREKLQTLYTSVNNNDTSHFLEYPVDVSRLLSDTLMVSPIVRAPGSDPADPTAASGDIAADPNADPELYMALQISLREEEARQMASRTAAAAEAAANQAEALPQPTSNVSSDHVTQIIQQELELSAEDADNEELRRILSLSLMDYQNTPEEQNVPSSRLLPPTSDIAMATTELIQSGDVGLIPQEDLPCKDTGQSQVDVTDESPSASSLNLPSAQPTLPEIQPSRSDVDPNSVLSELFTKLSGIDATNPELQEVIQQVINLDFAANALNQPEATTSQPGPLQTSDGDDPEKKADHASKNDSSPEESPSEKASEDKKSDSKN